MYKIEHILDSKEEILTFIYNNMPESLSNIGLKEATLEDLPCLIYDYYTSDFDIDNAHEAVCKFNCDESLDGFTGEYDGVYGCLQISYFEHHLNINVDKLVENIPLPAVINIIDMPEPIEVVDAENAIVDVNRWRIRRVLRNLAKKTGVISDKVLTMQDLDQLKKGVINELHPALILLDSKEKVLNVIQSFDTHMILGRCGFAKKWNTQENKSLYDKDEVNADNAVDLVNHFIGNKELDGISLKYNGVLGANELIQHYIKENSLTDFIGKVDPSNPCDLVRAINYIRAEHVFFKEDEEQ